MLSDATPAVFGHPPEKLATTSADARQYSPLSPGAASLEACAEGSLAGMSMLAVPGTLERRHDIALMLTALAPGAPFEIMAPKDMGGARLATELAAFGCTFDESAKAHHRICRGHRPDRLEGIAEAIACGAPRRLDDLGLWSQPGIFSWNRIDPGTALLIDALPALSGRGADLGCGIGLLAHGVLASPKVTKLDLLDIDRRAVASAQRNVDDPRAAFAWTDVRAGTGLSALDFVVMNPPFHDGGTEDKSLGQTFIRRAAEALRNGGHLWLTANRHLPYETVLKPLFKRVTPVIEAGGFKIIEAQK
jgi:16S rRNA (guanine1207-N2)-methyltransferase